MDYDSWLNDLRDVLQEQDSPLQLNNGNWMVKERKALWEKLGSRIFDKHIKLFKDCAVNVLTEIDPQFELASDERYAASIHGKNLMHSSKLRNGLAETLALLGCHGEVLVNCSQYEPESIASQAIHEIFDEADWQIWGSLNNLLPVLAEASPNEFLHAVENALTVEPCPFDSIFDQEGKGFAGRNYMTGLLWGLEGIAWNEEYLSRVALILADLASRDPGGNWANRPDNSLTTILLPWLPQTLASVEKRIISLKTVRLEFPDIAWNIALRLLPNQHQTSSGSHKPKWRNVVPDDWKPNETNQDYWDQVIAYAEIAVDMAIADLVKLKELVNNLDNLPKPSFDMILTHLSSDEIVELPEPDRLPIWTTLISFASKHRRYPEAKWSLDDKTVSKIEAVADRLAPVNPEGLYRRLFTGRDFDLYEESGDWEQQRLNLDKRREDAIQLIFEHSELEGVIAFSETVESSNHVGYSFGKIAGHEVDVKLLPKYLEASNVKHQKFISSFIWSRYQKYGLQWVDSLDRSMWSVDNSCRFLVCLPFEAETWGRAKDWLGKYEDDYWKKVSVNPYQSESDLNLAMDKLLKVSRPQPVIDCLYFQLHEKNDLNMKVVVKALLDAVSVKDSSSMDSYHIIELIKELQSNPEVSPDDLFNVEWAYLPLLDRHSGTEPKLLQKRLATEPQFFCEAIRLIYRSKNEDKQDDHIDEKKKSIATNAWRLLHEWKRPPGLLDDGSFSESEFKMWLTKVKDECAASGHLEVAMLKVGEVLFYCPEDPKGLWINHVVAQTLNDKQSDELRRGFRTEVFNSRGTHWVDPTGKPERELAVQWRKNANTIEDAGFARFASTLKELAESYERDAEQIITRHSLPTDKD